VRGTVKGEVDDPDIWIEWKKEENQQAKEKRKIKETLVPQSQKGNRPRRWYRSHASKGKKKGGEMVNWKTSKRITTVRDILIGSGREDNS